MTSAICVLPKKNKYREQHVCINFGFELGKTDMETCKMLKSAFKDETLT